MEPKALRTNVAIGHLLDSFEKCAYVGYTTIPFANIHIDPDVGRDNYCGIFPATSS